jgi:ATP-dependent Clp protease, protease subunit
MGTGYSIKARAGTQDAPAAEIVLYEDVGAGFFGDGVTARQFAEDLKALGKVDRINVRINSAGGDVFDGLTIYRRLVDHPATVITYVDGVAASIASVIAMAGKEIHIAESAFVMIHDAWGMVVGSAAEMRQMADLFDKATGSIADVYAKRTGQDMAKIRNWMASETWFTGSEAVDNKFATVVDRNMRIAAHLDKSKLSRFRTIPVALTERPQYYAANQRLVYLRSRLEQARLTKKRVEDRAHQGASDGMTPS